MAECIFCLKHFLETEKPTTLSQKGVDGIVKVNSSRALYKRKVFPSVGDKFHERCRKKYQKGTDDVELDSIASEGQQSEFSIRDNCLFCDVQISLAKSQDIHHVKSLNFRETLHNTIEQRNDEWATEVNRRIENVTDLAAAEAVYHRQCNVNFTTFRNKPISYRNPQDEPTKKGAPIDTHLNDSFLQLVEFLEKSDEPYGTNELNKKFQEFSGVETYSVRHLKDKLIKHFGDRIVFLSRSGLSDVVVMKEVSERIILKSYEEKTKSIQGIVTQSADIVLNDIKSIRNNKDTYALPSEIESVDHGKSFMPESLLTFLTRLFGQCQTDQTTKIVAIGHAIIQICRPRCVLSPTQLGLGVQISVLTGSRFLVDTLHSLGFCCSYSEVRKFRYCATISNGQEKEQSTATNTVTKYVADNVDHNLCTLDGKGTFHGMGMISIESLSKNGNEKRIARVNATIEDVNKVGSVAIIQYSDDAEENMSIKYTKLVASTIHDIFHKLDLLWTVSWPSVSDRPSWFGFMQTVTKGPFQTKPTITYLPMIDLSSSSLTCIYSTLWFIAKEAQNNGTSAVCTFDQPLYWKARLIIEHESDTSPVKKIVLMLGGFHMKMSFLGCIGYVMTGSGLQETLEQIYAPNSVLKMLNGKAVARSIRGHMLLYAALNAIINEEIINEKHKSIIASLFKEVLCNGADIKLLDDNPELIEIEQKMKEEKSKLKLLGPTSQLWIQYVHMMDILKSNIRGDRTGDYELHLKTAQGMHPFFAASGHNSYTKSIQVYLQDMQQLRVTNPDVHAFFVNGNFVTRRTNRYWSALPDDLVIEQVNKDDIPETFKKTFIKSIELVIKRYP